MNCRWFHTCSPVVMLAAISMGVAHAEENVGTDEPLEGHSHQGEAFNEGPRQAAYLIGGTGNVDFAVTTKSDEAQAFFNQGVGQLHGYWYFEAERSFRQVAKIDPDCAMAYWGMAQANIKNEERARGFIERAYEMREQVSDADRLHIEAYHRFLEQQDKKKDKDRRLQYIKDLEKIVYEHPGNIETRALIGNFFHLNYGRGVRPTSAQAYEDMMQVVLAKQPLHPVHHFRIHLWDDVREYKRGLDAAAKCGPSAPSVAHMWHMPGHIYSRLHRYHDAAWQQEASARVDHRHMMHDLVLPDQIHNYAHNNEWLCRNLMNLGRAHDAQALAANLVSLPRHPKYNMPDKRGRSSSYGRRRLVEVLSRFEMWDQLVAAYRSGDLGWGETPEQKSEYFYGLGVAQAYAGDLGEAADTLAELMALSEELGASIEIDRSGDKEQTDSEQHPNTVDGEEGENEATEESKKAELTKEQIEEQKAKEKEAKEERAKAERTIKAIAEQAAEIRALLHLAKGEKDQALAELDKAKKMDRYLQAVAYLQAGQNDKALKFAESQVSKEPNQVLPAARAAYLFEACGEQDKAAKAFEQLRRLAADADLDAPLFAKLTPLAERLELPADWRIARPPAEDLGDRPDLDTLGPFRWSPTKAATWELYDDRNAPSRLGDYAGRPVVVIFYLGHGCLHCVEQIHAFAKDSERFDALGIDLIGISSESQAELQQAVDQFGVGNKEIPFPLVCDPKHEVFRKYRCYDDFEDGPLHGTFLIDGTGKIRWHDISYEPFTDVDFLLKESQRLLNSVEAAKGLSRR